MKAQHFVLKLHFARALFGVWQLSSGTSGKGPTCQWRRRKRWGFDPWVRKICWRMAWQPTPVFLPGESHEQRGLVGYNPYSRRVRHYWSNLAHTHTHTHTHTRVKSLKIILNIKKIRRRTISKLNSVVAFKRQHKLTDMKSCPMEMGDQS